MTTTIRLPDMAAFEALQARMKSPQVLSPVVLSSPPPPAKRNPRGGHKRGEMNKSEAFFANALDLRKKAGEVRDWKFEAVKLTLADRCTYTPDFNVEMANGDLVMVEVKRLWKGKKAPHWEDDSRCKIKVCAEMFKGWFQFFGVHWDGEKWVYERF